MQDCYTAFVYIQLLFKKGKNSYLSCTFLLSGVTTDFIEEITTFHVFMKKRKKVFTQSSNRYYIHHKTD